MVFASDYPELLRLLYLFNSDFSKKVDSSNIHKSLLQHKENNDNVTLTLTCLH